MRKKRDNISFVHDIVDSIIKIFSYSRTHSVNDLKNNEWDQDALIRNLEIIGEAANNLDKSFRGQYAEIPWRKIIDFRNIVVHDYADIDIEIVWNIVHNDLPMLQKQINQILNKNSDN